MATEDEAFDDPAGEDLSAVDDEALEDHLLDVATAPAARDRRPTTPTGRRREARERVLSLLYEAEAKAMTPAEVLADLPVTPDPFVTAVVTGVGEQQPEIDALIVRFAIDWSVERMPVVDRTLLRMATYELIARPDVPTGVVISEAVELAKEYSTDESSRFVNGVLASIAGVIRTP